jgi:hypothetical protein
MSETKPTELTVRAKTTGEIAAHLRALADQFDTLGDRPIELTWINVGMQVQRPMEGEQRDAERHATVDLLASAFNCEPTTGKDGWRNADVYFGLTIYASVEKPAEPLMVPGVDYLPANDFAPIAGPSLATMHRKWLDRGLPASTWAGYAKTAEAVAEPARTTCGHTYIGNVGEFTCTLYAGHDGKHGHALAEFWWDDAEAVS